MKRDIVLYVPTTRDKGRGCISEHAEAAVTVTATIKKRSPRKGSDQQRVLECIQNSPGLRGVEVVQRLSGENPVHERTVRTAIARLKRDGKITQHESGGWFANTH